MRYAQTVNTGTKQAMKRYNFPNGQLVTYTGTKRECVFMPQWCTCVLTTISRMDAAKALRKLKNEFVFKRKATVDV